MSASSPLFETRLVSTEHTEPPVVVVGLPRSGSTFLSHVMSCIDDWWVFDDLYFYRVAMAQGADGPLTDEQLDRLTRFLGWQTRARIMFEDDFLRPNLTVEDVDRMCTQVKEACAGGAVDWPGLMREWLVRMALHHGRTRWGYKTPQDFMHLDALAEAYPGLKVVFLVRDPRKVMSSFKFLSGKDGDRRQYHPWAYARYWRLSIQIMKEAEKKLPVHVVRFEDLVRDPDTEASKIADFLGSEFSSRIPQMGENSSFGKGKRREINSTEAWMCERMASDEMEAMGYGPSEEAKLRVRDFPNLMATTARFSVHQSWRFMKDPGVRLNVGSFIKNLRKH